MTRRHVSYCIDPASRCGLSPRSESPIFFPSIKIEGRSTQFTRVADSGQKITFDFCPECGATIHYHQNHIPDVIAVPVGVFADPTFPAPRFSVYESRKFPWLTLSGDMEHHD